MRTRVLVVAPVVLLLSSCGAFLANSPKSPAASAQVIPWVDSKPAAYHQGLAVPVGEAFPPTCRADDLTATYRGAMGVSNGQMQGTVDIANVSTTPCVLQGVAAVELFGAKGATLSTSLYTNTRFTTAPVVLQAVAGLPNERVLDGHAWMEIDWSQFDEGGGGSCTPGLAQAAAIGLTVPGGGTLTTSAVSPRNDGPITFCPPRIGVGAFQRSAPISESAPPGLFQAAHDAARPRCDWPCPPIPGDADQRLQPAADIPERLPGLPARPGRPGMDPGQDVVRPQLPADGIRHRSGSVIHLCHGSSDSLVCTGWGVFACLGDGRRRLEQCRAQRQADGRRALSVARALRRRDGFQGRRGDEAGGVRAARGRQAKDERTALAQLAKLELERAAVPLRELAADEETEAGARLRTEAGIIDPEEPLRSEER